VQEFDELAVLEDLLVKQAVGDKAVGDEK